jgi:Lar family restriction alleviation protein
MIAMSDELKPCPFCGGEAVEDTNFGRPAVTCTDCHVSFRQIYKENVVDKWNARTASITPQMAAEVLLSNLKGDHIFGCYFLPGSIRNIKAIAQTEEG